MYIHTPGLLSDSPCKFLAMTKTEWLPPKLLKYVCHVHLLLLLSLLEREGGIKEEAF